MSFAKKGIHFICHPQLTAPAGLNAYQKMLGGLGMQRPVNFAYADPDGILLPNLSIEENILIDSMPISQYREHHFSLEQHLEQLDNVHMRELFGRLQTPKQTALSCDAQTRKVATLLKALLRDAPYLFLDFPERHLSPQTQDIFMQALEVQVRAKSQLCFITSDQEMTWRKIATALISQDENKQWQILPAPSTHLIGTFLPTFETELDLDLVKNKMPSPVRKVS